MNINLLHRVAENSGAFGKVHGGLPVGPSSFRTGESGFSMLNPAEAHLSNIRGDETSTVLASGKVVEQNGSPNTLTDSNRIVQVYLFYLYD